MLAQENGPLDRVNRFFAGIAPWAACYRSKSFSFFGRRDGAVVEIHHGRVRLGLAQPRRQGEISVGNFLAGRLPLTSFGMSPEEFVDRLAQGAEVCANTGMRFRIAVDSQAGLYVEPPDMLHPEGMQTARRLSVLTIQGGSLATREVRTELDWAARAAPTPFDSLADLLAHFELSGQNSGRCTLDVVAHGPVEVLLASQVRDEVAHVGIWLPRGLRRRATRLSYTVYDKGQCVTRGSVRGSALSWTKNGLASIGTVEVPVPRAAIVHCHAVYAKEAHHSYWIGDPKAAQNPRLAAFGVIDKDHQLLKSYLLPSEPRGSAQYHFESAVAWMLWALGMSVVQTDRADQAKDGPDILAVAPSGGQLVVECTLGVLKSESKLAKVARRAQQVRESLQKTGAAGPPVIPVIVTSLPRQQVSTELDAATEAGVLVVAREELESALDEVLLFPDGDRIFRRAQDAVRSAVEELDRKRRRVQGEG